MPLTPYTDGRNRAPETPRPAPTTGRAVPSWVYREDVPSPAACRHGVALYDYCGTCEADWYQAWTPEDRKALDSGAWVGLALLALVAVVAFVAGRLTA